MIRWKHERNELLRKTIIALLQTALESVIGHKLHIRVLASSIEHTDLEPEGDLFNLHFRVEVHPNKQTGSP